MDIRRASPELYETISQLDHILALSLVRMQSCLSVSGMAQVFSHACAVFALEDFASMAVLSSSVHSTWVIRYASTIRTDIRYSPSDVFLTLPRPEPTRELEVLGRELDELGREF